MTVPATRVRALNQRPIDPAGDFVLYWMTTARRLHYNFALQRSVDLAIELRKPLLILEAVDVDYPWASDRLHRFILDGMQANARQARSTAAHYYPYVEPAAHAGRGLLSRVSSAACAIVTDDYPAFFIPAITASAARQSAARVESVDSNGLIPVAAHGRAFTSARAYRAFAQRELRTHLVDFPEPHPLARLDGRRGRTHPLPGEIRRRWPEAARSLLAASPRELARLPIDHGVGPVSMRGGSEHAAAALARFLEAGLPRYALEHNHPDADCTSRLSPYLHFGHLSAHEIFSAVMTRERWTTRRLNPKGGGAREGWWGVGASANTFLDQLVVWRELAFNGCEYVPRYTTYASLPEWARATLEAHANDRRQQYRMADLEAARTADPVWNAAQRQLVAEGWFHGYLRMLWGKKILEWSPDPQTALDRMEALMNRYSLDGRDPVSYASFTWVLGRYDRPWPPRPVFGTVRCLSSAATRRKLRLKAFMDRYGDQTC